jgi:phosphate transport system permease protein
MTDIATSIDATSIGVEQGPGVHTGDAAKARLRRRYRAEARFRWLGAGAVALSALFLVLLLATIVTQALPAFRMNYVTLPVDLSAARVDPANPGATNFAALAQDALAAKFPGVESRQERRLLRGLLSSGADDILRRAVAADPSLLGKTVDYSFPLDDFADLYLKGLVAETGSHTGIATTVRPSGVTGDIELTFGDDSIAGLARGHGATEAKRTRC